MPSVWGKTCHPSHHCSERQLRLVVLGDDQDEVLAIEVDEEAIEEAWEYNTVRMLGFPEDVGKAEFRMLGGEDEEH